MKPLFLFPVFFYWKRLIWLFTFINFPLLLIAQNQNFKLPELDQKAYTYTFQLKDAPEVEGTREGYMKGETEAQPLQFAVKDLGYALYPVTVTILCDDPNEELLITFVKEHWGDTVSMTTTHRGGFQEQFKVAMEFGFKIQSVKTGVKFNVAVWVGKEMKLKNSRLFYPTAQYMVGSEQGNYAGNDPESKGKTELNIVLIIISIVLTGIFIILLGVLIFLKTKKKTLIIIGLLTVPGLLNAGAGPSSFQNFTAVLELFNKVNELSGKISSLEAAAEGWKAYSEADQQFEPETDPRGMPQLPSSCLKKWPGPNGNGSGNEGRDSRGNNHKNPYNDRKDDKYNDNKDHKESASDSDKKDGGTDRKVDQGANTELLLNDSKKDKDKKEKKLLEDRKNDSDNSEKDEKLPGGHNGGMPERPQEERDNKFDNPDKGGQSQNGGPSGETPNANPEDNHSGGDGGPDHDDDCQCLEDAYAELNELRYKFEKLRIIYKTTKDMSDKAVAFGDGLAPSTGIASIAWQNERVKIMDSMKGLEKAYDKKYAQFVDDLYLNLKQISECEVGLGFEQWYDKVGFIYFEFMNAHYERND